MGIVVHEVGGVVEAMEVVVDPVDVFPGHPCHDERFGVAMIAW